VRSEWGFRGGQREASLLTSCAPAMGGGESGKLQSLRWRNVARSLPTMSPRAEQGLIACSAVWGGMPVVRSASTKCSKKWNNLYRKPSVKSYNTLVSLCKAVGAPAFSADRFRQFSGPRGASRGFLSESPKSSPAESTFGRKGVRNFLTVPQHGGRQRGRQRA